MGTCAALVVVGASEDPDTVVGAPEVETPDAVVEATAEDVGLLVGATVVGASVVGAADDGVTVAVHDTTETGRSGVMSFDRTGAPAAFAPFDDPYTTHVVFGGPDRRTAYVTLSATGRIVTLPWPVAGHPAVYGPPS